jgi:hypothetical protein
LASQGQIARAGVAALAVGGVGGAALGWLGWVSMIPALVLGLCVGSAAFLASGRHRDASIQGVAGGAALLSIVLAAIITAVGATPEGAMAVFPHEQFILPTLAAMAGAALRFLF